MTCLRRIVSFLLCLGMFFSANTFAANHIQWSGYTGVYDTAIAACQSYAGHFDAPSSASSITASYNASYNQFRCGWNGNPFQVASEISGQCINGSRSFDQITGLSTCAEDAPVAPACTAGKKSTLTFPMGTVSSPTDTAHDPLPTSTGTCDAQVTKLVHCYVVAAGSYPKTFYCTYEMQENGTVTPNGSATAPVTDAPSAGSGAAPVTPSPQSAGQGKSCPAGTVNMGVDSAGGVICGGTGTSPVIADKVTTAAPTTNTANSDGSTTQVSSSGSKNSDGSTTTTTTTTTTNPDGSTSTTTAVATGKTSAGSDGQPDKDDFCSKNPQMNVCRNSSVSGACDSIAFDGDAIQGAILQSVAKQNCLHDQDVADVKASASYALGQQMLAGADPTKAAADAAIKGSEVDLSGTSLDQSGFVSGSCFSDRTITLMGRSVPVSFSRICSSIEPLRYAVLACSLIAAYLLVSKSVLQG